MSCLFCSWCPSGRNNILHRESELLHMAQCKWFNWFKRKHFSLLSSLPAVFLFRPLVVCLFGFLSALAAVLFSGARGGSQPLRICWTTNFIAVWWGGKHFRWFEHNVRYGTYYIYKQDRGLVGVLLTSGVLQCHLGIAELAEEWGLPVEARSQDPTLWICEVTNRHGQALACHSHIANGRNNAACCSLLVRLSNYIGVSWCIQSDSWK